MTIHSWGVPEARLPACLLSHIKVSTKNWPPQITPERMEGGGAGEGNASAAFPAQQALLAPGPPLLKTGGLSQATPDRP